MKTLFLFLTILFPYLLYSQEEPTYTYELAIEIKNNTFGDQISAEMDLVSVCWDVNINDYDTMILPTLIQEHHLHEQVEHLGGMCLGVLEILV